MNADKTASMCFKPRGDISTQNGGSLKLVDTITYLGSNVSSLEKDINTRHGQVSIGNQSTNPIRYNAIFPASYCMDALLEYWQSVESKSLKAIAQGWYEFYKQILEATSNKKATVRSLPPISKIIQIRRKIHVEQCRRERTNS